MRYIRTKDGIEGVPDYYAKKLIETPTLKIADTIEELCDLFVMANKSTNKYKIYACLINANADYMFHCENIYGAIWTDKGLIYVAKMNEEGELELL